MTDAAEIARLKAAAAQAAADAAAAQAAAAQAALDAALAGAADAEEPTTAAEPEAVAPVAQPAPATQAAVTSSAPLSEYGQTVREGYDFSTPALPIGTFMDSADDDAEPVPAPDVKVGIPLSLLNRHCLVAGATGTGKTRTLQLMAEGLSAAGVPVFLTDIKGDLTGLAQAGQPSEKLAARSASIGQDWTPSAFPVELLTLGGKGQGTPIRTTITDFGPLLLARVLDLNETQTSALQLVFHWADEQGLALLDLKDLRAVVDYLTNTDAGKEELRGIGGVSTATAGVILRELAALEAEGGDVFFGEPAFTVADLMRTSADGKGLISSLELPDMASQGALFSTFTMWLLAELFETLPEVGNPDKPKLVFFFDEAHLLFDDASEEFLKAVTQTVRLIRSKGVGIVFVTQSPTDVPEEVLAQLGSRVQHALRAHTPADAKNLKKAVTTFPNSPLDLAEVLTSLGTGQAVVTVLDEKGRPTPVAPVMVNAPAAEMGPADAATVTTVLGASTLAPKYAQAVDNESAYELLEQRVAQDAAAAQAAIEAEAARKEAEKAAADAQKAAEKEAKERAKEAERLARQAQKDAERRQREAEREEQRRRAARDRVIESTVKSVGRTLGRSLTRSLLGNLRR